MSIIEGGGPSYFPEAEPTWGTQMKKALVLPGILTVTILLLLGGMWLVSEIHTFFILQ